MEALGTEWWMMVLSFAAPDPLRLNGFRLICRQSKQVIENCDFLWHLIFDPRWSRTILTHPLGHHAYLLDQIPSSISFSSSVFCTNNVDISKKTSVSSSLIDPLQLTVIKPADTIYPLQSVLVSWSYYQSNRGVISSVAAHLNVSLFQLWRICHTEFLERQGDTGVSSSMFFSCDWHFSKKNRSRITLDVSYDGWPVMVIIKRENYSIHLTFRIYDHLKNLRSTFTSNEWPVIPSCLPKIAPLSALPSCQDHYSYYLAIFDLCDPSSSFNPRRVWLDSLKTTRTSVFCSLPVCSSVFDFSAYLQVLKNVNPKVVRYPFEFFFLTPAMAEVPPLVLLSFISRPTGGLGVMILRQPSPQKEPVVLWCRSEIVITQPNLLHPDVYLVPLWLNHFRLLILIYSQSLLVLSYTLRLEQ